MLYVKPELRDLSQGSRIAFVRELRHLSQVKNINKPEIKLLINSLQEWKKQKIKREKHEISYEEYLNWKLNYEIKGEDRLWVIN